MKHKNTSRLSALLLGCCMLLSACAPGKEIPRPAIAAWANGMPNYTIQVPEMEEAPANLFLEAESARFTGSLHVDSTRGGFTGEGYVTGFDGKDAGQFVAGFYAPATQHYDITLCAAADKDVTNTLIVNGTDIGQFTVTGSGAFIRVTYHGIFLEKGQIAVSIGQQDGGLDLDSITLTNNTEISETDYTKATADPINENASDRTRELLAFLKEQYGKSVLTGQYASSAQNKELEVIHNVTGQYPVIRFGDLSHYTSEDCDDPKEIEAAIEWDKKGGIVGYMWYWSAPMGEQSVYSKDATFDLHKAVTKEDIACMSEDDLRAMCKDGAISEECLALLLDIDEAAQQLKRLQEADIPVLWRPLHEAGGGWYWWGSDGVETYKWLWRLMYNRMTYYYELNNLIWIWNGQSADAYVGSAYFDIASIDLYLPANAEFGSRNGQFQWLYGLTGGEKMLAISECSTVPDLAASYRDNAVWSFFGLWYGDYLLSKDGSFSEAYTTRDKIVKCYNSDGSMHLAEYVTQHQK